MYKVFLKKAVIATVGVIGKRLLEAFVRFVVKNHLPHLHVARNAPKGTKRNRKPKEVATA